MRKAMPVVAVVAASLTLAGSLHAEWVQTAGPRGIRVNVFWKSANVVYAGTNAKGVYRSTDNGATWQSANTGIEHTSIHDLIVSGPHLLAAVVNPCGPSGVYRSTDSGAHWIFSNGPQFVNAFAIKDNFVYLAASDFDTSIHRSSDNGVTWQPVPSPLEGGNEIIVSGNAIIVAEFNFIWRSTDDGASWDPVEQFALSGVQSFTRTGTRLLGAGVTGLYTSIDNGANWTFSEFTGGALSLTSVGSTVFLGSGGRVSRSTDSGLTWVNASTNLGKGDIRALLYDGATVFAGTPSDTAGVYLTANGGASWSPSASGFPVASTIRATATLSGNLFAGMEVDGIYRSTDLGASWSKVGLNNPALQNQLIFSFCTKNGLLFAGGANGIFRSTDGGVTFDTVVNGIPTGGQIAVPAMTVSGNRLVAAVNIGFDTSSISAIFYSDNNGNSWQQGTFPVVSVYMAAVASDGGSTVFAGSFGETFMTTGLYKSVNGGANWTSMTFSFNNDIDRLAVTGSNVLASNLFGAFFSTDAGETFANSNPPGGGIFTYTLKDEFIFAGNQEGIFYSMDQGASWNDGNLGFDLCPRPSIEATGVSTTHLFAGTIENAVWRRPLSDFGVTSVAGDLSGAPPTFYLEQNHPNPPDPFTSIAFSLSRPERVTLKLFNALGQEVSTLAAGAMSSGPHSYDWDASGVASGVYYYRLEAGDFAATRKLIVVK